MVHQTDPAYQTLVGIENENVFQEKSTHLLNFSSKNDFKLMFSY